MKNFTKTILAVLAAGALSCALFSPSAQAIPITGTVTFAGGVEFDNPLATATMATVWHNTHVESADGAFAAGGLVVNTPATFTAPWVFVSATPMLWSSGIFSFDLNAGATVTRPIIGGVQFLLISGFGTIHGTGYTDTAGMFSFTTQNPGAGGIFSFSAATQSVPDGGSAVALLGAALAGIEILRRKLRAA